MFLKNLMKKNSELLEVAISWHQSGLIPPNTWLLDLDTIYENAKVISTNAKKENLQTYFMTKQIGRNPFAVKAALHAGIDKTVAVDITCAKQLHRYQIPIGHIGHLSQVPKHLNKVILEMNPDVVTLYSLTSAEALNSAAKEKNVIQNVLIKVADHDGLFLPGQESGIMIHELHAFVTEILEMKHLKIVGVTAFPCITYNNWITEDMSLTTNTKAITRAVKILENDFHLKVSHINMPGNTSSETMKLFKEIGATHVEPGHGITGTTPEHIYNPEAKENPALVYVSEISHLFNNKAYAFGGGLYVCMGGGPLGYPVKALVGSDYQTAKQQKLSWEQLPLDNIDYYGMLTPIDNIKVGDTVLFGFRPQMFITRANIAVVGGLKKGKPKLMGTFDSACNMVDEHHNIISPQVVNQIIDQYLSTL